MKVWLHDRLVDEKDARVSVFDHGFLYGDGIYETVRAYNYQIFHWDDHYRRLLKSAQRIELRCPWSNRLLRQRIEQVLRANHEPDASVRITVARGPGPLGLNPYVCPRPTLALMLHPHRDVERFRQKGVSIGIPRVRRNPPEALDPQIKSNNSLNTILAKMEAEKMGVFEAVLINLKGELTEGTTTNIFFVKRRQLYTPALSCGLLEGVTREAVIRLARRAGLKVTEGKYKVRELLGADEAFLCSTTLEVMPIIKVKKTGESGIYLIGEGVPGQITSLVYILLKKYIEVEIAKA